MKNSIEILKQVQELDSEIYASRELIEGVPSQLAEVDASLEAERGALKRAEEELRSIQLEQKKKEAELQDKEAMVKKYEGQLDLVKTNKEYASLQSEIRSLKADSSLLEEAIITLLDRVDEHHAKVKAEKEQFEILEKASKEKKAAFQHKANQAEDKIQSLTEKRQELIKGIHPEVASLYERIVLNRRGLALTRVDGEVCTACHMQLRPQQINELQKAEKVILCEQCSRILYFE